MSYYYELLQDLPEGAEPWKGYCECKLKTPRQHLLLFLASSCGFAFRRLAYIAGSLVPGIPGI